MVDEIDWPKTTQHQNEGRCRRHIIIIVEIGEDRFSRVHLGKNDDDV